MPGLLSPLRAPEARCRDQLRRKRAGGAGPRGKKGTPNWLSAALWHAQVLTAARTPVWSAALQEFWRLLDAHLQAKRSALAY